MSRDYQLQPFRPPVELQIDYANALNEQQHAAVTAEPGPALVIAGAGSGKTRTLTYRVAYLLEHGVPADRILLLTFTNKAAREMMHRVADLLGNVTADLWGGTFHSIGNRILRRHADRLGYRPDFTILDREDAKDLLNACIDDSKIDVKATRFPNADVLGDIFSLATNKLLTIPEVLESDYGHFSELAPQITDIAARFAARKRKTGVMDFDDLLVLWLKLLQDHVDVRELYQRRFQFILVDEYQDTNKLQSDLIDLLGARHRNVMVVGDDSQSIYSWRGANFKNILEFPKRYPGAKVYKIELNYRSTPEILALANAAIAANINQFVKELSPVRKSGLKPAVVVCHDGGEQAAFVSQRVLELRDEGVNLNEMAVLYRSHFHAMELQMELTRRNIPFSITSGIRFFEQAHVKDVAAYLKLVCNPADELSFKRIVRLLPGVGGRGADKLWNHFSTAHTVKLSTVKVEPLAPVVPDEEPDWNVVVPRVPLAPLLQACASSVPKKTVVEWAQFTATISQLETDDTRRDPGKMIRLVVEAGYQDYLQAEYTNYRSRLEDLEQLAEFSRQFETVEEFLSQLALLTNVEAVDDRPANDDQEQLRLSSIHQAKGLEFKVVFVIMLCDGLFPSSRSVDRGDLEDEEEERRLFYVAITRAKDELYLTYPLLRFMTGQGGDPMQRPSRFLHELPPELREDINLRPYNPYG
jgi:DNA helicase-2/ATP-dependent DNA helicase PcrA